MVTGGLCRERGGSREGVKGSTLHWSGEKELERKSGIRIAVGQRSKQGEGFKGRDTPERPHH